jgi:hypothetical protein
MKVYSDEIIFFPIKLEIRHIPNIPRQGFTTYLGTFKQVQP